MVPAVMDAGPVLTTDKSAEVFAVVYSVDVLLPGFGSVVVVITVAELVIVVPLGMSGSTAAVIVRVTTAPLARVPMVQTGDSQEPLDGLALTKERPAGRMSLTDTFCADDGPLFDTVIV